MYVFLWNTEVCKFSLLLIKISRKGNLLSICFSYVNLVFFVLTLPLPYDCEVKGIQLTEITLLFHFYIWKDTGMKNFRLYSSAQISEFDGFDDKVIQKTTFSDKKLAVIAHGYTG